MEEEPQLIRKSEEEIKEEVKEEVKRELQEEQGSTEKKRKIGSVISKTIFGLLFLVIVVNTVIGVISVQKVNDGKEPIWYIDKKDEKTDKGSKTTYNLALYVIIKSQEGNESKTTLTPFFLK